MKLSVLLITLASTGYSCGSTSSRNTYNGAAENYACTTADGTYTLALAANSIPSCIKLSDLPPDEAKAIVDAAHSGQPLPYAPHTLAISPL